MISLSVAAVKQLVTALCCGHSPQGGGKVLLFTLVFLHFVVPSGRVLQSSACVLSGSFQVNMCFAKGC